MLERAWPAIASSALVLAAVSIFLSAFLFAKLSSEGSDRRDQTCLRDEREHLQKVTDLRNTYALLSSPEARRQLGPGLVALVVRELPKAEREARTDRAPSFCDEAGFGLPEPDPVVPERPEGLR